MTSQTFMSVTDIVREKDPGGTVNNGCGVQTVPSWTAPYTGPTPVQASFIPVEERAYLYDPSKGRKFSAAKKSGSILMSEYTRGVDKTTRYVSSIKRKFTHASYTSTGKCGSTGLCAVYGPNPVSASWTENYHIGMLSNLPKRGNNLDYYRAQVPSLVSSTQQQAFSNAMNAYDLLTELGEMGETLSYLMGKVDGFAGLMDKFRSKDPESYREGRRSNAKTLLKSTDAGLRKLGGRWMEYRYALMPLFYSFKDISGLIKEHAVKFHTERAKAIITLGDHPVLYGSNYLINKTSGTIEVRSMTKASYDLGSLQRLVSTIGFNPIKTAWELVPLSFVVDWAINVGDAISSLTSLDYSSQRAGCTVVRSKVREEVVHHREVTDVVSWDWGANQCGYRPTPWNRIFTADFDNIVQITEVDSYVRTLWSRPEPKIIFDPYLTWKRIIDGIVLGYQPTKKILRSLR